MGYCPTFWSGAATGHCVGWCQVLLFAMSSGSLSDPVSTEQALRQLQQKLLASCSRSSRSSKSLCCKVFGVVLIDVFAPDSSSFSPGTFCRSALRLWPWMVGLLNTHQPFELYPLQMLPGEKALVKPAMKMSRARCWSRLRAEEAESLLVSLWSWHSV